MAKPRASCGTTAAYMQHRLRDEPTCDECRAAWNTYHQLQRERRIRNPGPPPPMPCPCCGWTFQPTNVGHKHCSSRCSVERLGPPESSAVAFGPCRSCGDVTVCRRHRQPTKCSTCRTSDLREKNRRKLKRRKARLAYVLLPTQLGPTRKDIPPEFRPTRGDMPAPQSCDWCNLDFYHCRPHRFCSESCRDFSIPGRRATVSDLQAGECRRCGDTYCVSALRAPGFCSAECLTRHRRSVQKRQRRMLKRAGDGYTLREIAERDGWRCHLCGGKVPDREYAARDKDATVDHLIPVSAGGDDIRSNVALAHNRCNWERGNAGLAQLRLVG